MPCDTKPAASIAASTAAGRIAIFTDLKNPALEKKTGKREIAKIVSDPGAFLDLLKNLTANANCDGIRIYFALKDDVLALIFVPTLADKTDPKVHNDDLDNCWLLTTGRIVRIDSKDASGLIVAFEKQRLVYFQDDGKSVVGQDYLETKSLWYSIALFGSNGKDGLIDYLDCLISNGLVSEVDVWFGGFLQSDQQQSPITPHYQLTLVFQFLEALSATRALTAS
ncbi:MAG: hypothetical protein ABI683_11970 [Ginsengibacter sp.]